MAYTTSDYLTQLQADKQALVNNLVEKGVEATNEETFTSLVPKVLDIQSGGSEVTKGLRIDSYDENGNITEVTLVGMTEIPDYYLYQVGYKQTSLMGKAKLNLPDTITKIGNTALSYNIYLTISKLPDSLISIGPYGFNGCGNLALTELPSGLRELGMIAFSGCTKLALTKLPNGITDIPQQCFSDCSNLALTELPSGLTSIGTYAFQNCKKLAIKEIPAGVTRLNVNCFYGCTNLTEINCLGDITYINQTVFRDCTSLAKVIFSNITAVPTLANANAFQNTPIQKGTGYIYVPDTLLENFKSASNWSTYASVILPISQMPTE